MKNQGGEKKLYKEQPNLQKSLNFPFKENSRPHKWPEEKLTWSVLISVWLWYMPYFFLFKQSNTENKTDNGQQRLHGQKINKKGK